MLLQASNETDGVLNFTVQPHFPAQIYSSPIRELQVLTLLRFPSASEPLQPAMLGGQFWEQNHDTSQLPPREHTICFQRGTKTEHKSIHLKNMACMKWRVLLPWKKNKEVKEQLPCPREQRRPCYFHLSEGLPLFNSVLPSVNPACISYRTLELLLFPSAVFCGPLEGEGTQVDVCPFWPVNAESHNTTESESSTHFFSSFVTKTCLFIQTEKQEPQEDVSTSVTQHGEGKGRRTWGPLQLITTPQACSALSAHYLWWIATDPCQVGSVLWLSQIFCNPLLKTTKRVSAPGLTAPWQTAGAHNPAQAMQETACVQWQWGGSCSSFLGVPVRNRTSFWPSLSSLQPGYFPCQAEEHALPLLKELLF